MNNVFFFGTGDCAKLYANKVNLALKSLGDFQLVGFLDNDTAKVGTVFEGYRVYNPGIIKKFSCDMVLLFLLDDTNYVRVIHQLSDMISIEKIHRYDFPLKVMVQKRYKDSTDREIKETLEYILNHQISVFNQFIHAESTYDEVKWDKQVSLPYIDFTTAEGRKVPMYYPENYRFTEKDGSFYIKNLMWEQSEGSPHLYIQKNHDVENGDCIIDAGVCEGNFALKYVDIASHIYLFEMDPIWKEPLTYTFQNYENKVTIVYKAVSDRTKNDECRIDDVVSNRKIDFIKMDVEGAELSAIRGAEHTFCTNDIKSSICSYHRNGDEKRIREQLEKYGYQTTVSDGYMLYLFSDDTWEKGDFRRGMVYGKH